MRLIGKTLIAVTALFAFIQLIRPGIPEQSATEELQAPDQIKRILHKSCYSCHSNERRLAWFDEIVPGYWLVRHDILVAREQLNLSIIGSKPLAFQRATLFEAINMIQLGAMPITGFRQLHPEARVTTADLAALKAYVSPWGDRPGQAGNQQYAGAKPDAVPLTPSGQVSAPVNLASIPPEFNGLKFDPSFRDWTPLSTTDRGDNNTFRFILGNETAAKAVHEGHLNPWPDGARLAKIAWMQESREDGLIYPGKFIQVELMIKDAQRYRSTEGWGWGRWRGLSLKPYGQNAGFVNECTGCHLPVRGNDDVYTLPITAAKVNGQELVNNRAVLPKDLPYQPLAWQAITMYVDPEDHTMATLYGNELAMRFARQHSSARPAGAYALGYAPGSVLGLVTWTQREDPHWFGARIPNGPRSVEFVQVTASDAATTYRRFSGQPLSEDHSARASAASRAKFLLGLKPADLP